MWAWLKHETTLYTPKRHDEHPCHFYVGVPSGGWTPNQLTFIFVPIFCLCCLVWMYSYYSQSYFYEYKGLLAKKGLSEEYTTITISPCSMQDMFVA